MLLYTFNQRVVVVEKRNLQWRVEAGLETQYESIELVNFYS